MKHAAIAFAGLLAPGCVSPPSPVARDEHWYRLEGATVEVAAINVHETPQGYAGRLVKADGSAIPLRDVRRDQGSLAFYVPEFGATFTGVPGDGGGWAGQWQVSGDTSAAAVTLAPSAAPAEQGIVVTISGGRQIHLTCFGEGAPAVILDYGAGGTQKKDWGAIARTISETAGTRTCTYDRAARGISDPGPLPRTATAVVQDLDEALTSAHIAPPYVLVGHSLGSYHVRLFANTRFDKMAGLVLVDPSGDGQTERFAAVVPKLVEEQNKLTQAQANLNCIAKLREKPVPANSPLASLCGGNDPAAIDATRSEVAEMPGASTAALVASRRSYGDLPVIVLTRGDYDKGMPSSMSAEDRAGMKQVWEAMHAEMAALSTRGEQRTVPGAGHYIQGDAPDAVIRAIADVVATARAPKS